MNANQRAFRCIYELRVALELIEEDLRAGDRERARQHYTRTDEAMHTLWLAIVAGGAQAPDGRTS